MSQMIKISFLAFSLLILLMFSVSHTGEKSDILPKGSKMGAKAIEGVIKEHARELMAIPGVVGAGQGLCEGKRCIKIFVIKKTPELVQKIPDTLDGYQVVIEETGEVKARKGVSP
jgi:ribosomal protein S19